MIAQPAFPTAEAASEAFAKACYETLGLWESSWRIWAEYVTDLSQAVTPEALIDANARFVASWLEAPGLAAGEVQREGGLKAPTLVEA